MPRGTRAAAAVLLAALLLVFLHACLKLSPHDAWLLLEHGPLTLRQAQVSATVQLPRLAGNAFAYATLVNNAHYVHLCTVLAASLRASGSKHPLLVLALPEALRAGTGIDALRGLDGVIVLPIKPLPITPNIRLDQAHWLFAFSKLRIWQQTQYTRLVYIDGEPNGRTNEMLRVDAGTHVFELGNLDNFQPAQRKLLVQDTSVLEPLEVAFFRKEA